jgi:hypothetical protein
MKEFLMASLTRMNSSIDDAVKTQADCERVLKKKLKEIEAYVFNAFTSEHRAMLSTIMDSFRDDLPLIEGMYFCMNTGHYGDSSDSDKVLAYTFFKANRGKILRTLETTKARMKLLTVFAKGLYEADKMPIEDTLNLYCGYGSMEQRYNDLLKYFRSIKVK